MNKTVMMLCASPVKNGNTRTALEWIAQGVKESGGSSEVIDLTRLHYKASGCIACMGCQKSEKYECVIEDEAKPLLSRIPEADVLVLATPLYFFGPTAQLKVFTDRMYSLFKFDSKTHEVRHNLKNTLIALVSTAGGDAFGTLEETMKTMTGFAGLQYRSLLIPYAGLSGALKDNEDARQTAIAFGRALCL